MGSHEHYENSDATTRVPAQPPTGTTSTAFNAPRSGLPPFPPFDPLTDPGSLSTMERVVTTLREPLAQPSRVRLDHSARSALDIRAGSYEYSMYWPTLAQLTKQPSQI